MRRMLAGDESAFERFAECYLPALYRFTLRRLRGDRELTREIVQATVCRAIDKLGTYRGEAALLTWLCACSRNEIAAHFRRQGSRGTEVQMDPETFSGPVGQEAGAPERALLRSESRALVHLALDSLPERYGHALELKYIRELPVREIARRLGVSAKAAESLLSRARPLFRERYHELIRQGAPREVRWIGGTMGFES